MPTLRKRERKSNTVLVMTKNQQFYFNASLVMEADAVIHKAMEVLQKGTEKEKYDVLGEALLCLNNIRNKVAETLEELA